MRLSEGTYYVKNFTNITSCLQRWPQLPQGGASYCNPLHPGEKPEQRLIKELIPGHTPGQSD